MAHRHGFVCPMGVHQVVALVTYTYLLLIYYVLTAPYLPSTASHIALQVLYAVAAAATLALGVAATWSDPSDPSLKDSDAATIPTGYKCSICQVYVRPRSKHCRVCDRCTEDFDHHCMWLNNCVGRANYSYFFMLLCSTLLLCSAQFGISLYLFIQSFVHHSLIQPLQLRHFNGRVSMNGLRVVWPLSAVLSACLAGLLADLFTFHLVLQWKGMSTYDYILAQREVQEQQAQTASPQHLQQCKCPGLHGSRKARVTPDTPLDNLSSSTEPKKPKFKVKLNPVTAWRVKSSTSGVRPAHARARMSSMAQYIMPALFTSKSSGVQSPSAAQQALPMLPGEAGEQVSAVHNPIFDIEAHTPHLVESPEASMTRLPVLLSPSVGPSLAWSPSEAGSPQSTPHPRLASDALQPHVAVEMPKSNAQPDSVTVTRYDLADKSLLH